MNFIPKQTQESVSASAGFAWLKFRAPPWQWRAKLAFRRSRASSCISRFLRLFRYRWILVLFSFAGVSLSALQGAEDEKMLTKDRRPIGFLTCSGFEEYKTNEKKICDLCSQRGISAERVIWDDLEIDWSKYSAIVVSSTWDYYLPEKINLFLSTLKKIKEAHIPMMNSFESIEWNHNKRYLQDLALKGISIPDTIWISSDELSHLPSIIEQKGWKECVLKPLISAGGNRTYRFQAIPSQIEEIVKECDPLHFDWMLQPFLEEILTEGEWSFIFIDGKYTQTILKKPASGEFRVQPFRGASAVRVDPEPWMIEEAERILHACLGEPLYARVDVILQEKKLLVMEVELIEPYLYDSLNEAVAEKFFSGIMSQLLSLKTGMPPASFYPKAWASEPLTLLLKEVDVSLFSNQSDPEFSSIGGYVSVKKWWNTRFQSVKKRRLQIFFAQQPIIFLQTFLKNMVLRNWLNILMLHSQKS